MTWQPEIDDLNRRKDLAKLMGGAGNVQRQHDGGKLTVRERIAGLVDPGSFDEAGELAGKPEHDEDGKLFSIRPANYILGFAKVGGRRVVAGGDDFTSACRPF